MVISYLLIPTLHVNSISKKKVKKNYIEPYLKNRFNINKDTDLEKV